MTTRLSSSAQILSGYHFRTKITDEPTGTLGVIQPKDINPDRSINLQSLIRIKPDRAYDKVRLKPGDLLVLARGPRPYATLVTQDAADTITTAVHHIVRPNPRLIDSEFLCWFLNSPVGNTALTDAMFGTDIPALSTSALADQKIPLPPLDRQRAAAATAKLLNESLQLTATLTKDRHIALALSLF